MPVEVECPVCKKSFQVYPGYLKKIPNPCCCYTCKGIYLAKPFEERFWARVIIKGPDDCWLWTGGITKGGYGNVWGGGFNTSAHRVAWMLTHGLIMDNIDICHNCPTGDNRLCCNPKHLFEGTRSENMTDASKKGRATRGETHPFARLTEDKIREIRRIYSDGGITFKDLGRRYGVWRQTITDIVRCRTWKHVK